MSFNFKDAQLTYFNQDLQLTSKLKGVFLTSVTATFTAIAQDVAQSQTVTLKGLLPISGGGSPPNIAPGDVVLVQPTAALASGLSLSAFVSAANTLTITLNNSAASQTPGATNFVVMIFKFGQIDGLSA